MPGGCGTRCGEGDGLGEGWMGPRVWVALAGNGAPPSPAAPPPQVQEFGVCEVRDLKPNGANILVTEENKKEYVHLVCQMRMTGRRLGGGSGGEPRFLQPSASEL